MNMRPGTPTLRTPRSAHAVYEDLQPKSELKENEDAYFLRIYLPGFTKENIKISYVASSRIVRIVGEQRVDGSNNRWNRFNQSYPVPENCEVEKLQGKFERGTLTVTMPKMKFIPPPPTPRAQVVETTKLKETTPPKSTATTRVEEKQEPIGDQKSISDALKEQKGTQENTSPSQKPKDIVGHRHDEDYKGLRTLSPAKPFEEETVLANPKEETGKPQMGVEPNRKQIDEEKFQEEIRKKLILETVKKQLEDEKAAKESVKKEEVKGEEDTGKPNYESRKPEKYVVHDVVLKGKEIKARKEFAPKATDEKGKETSTIYKAKEDEKYTIGKGIKEAGTWSSKVVTRIGEGKLDDQEKTLVANMGAAILVIAALGAYVTYKFTSSSKD